MKITSAMYMISSAKLRSAKQKLEQTEPYFYALQGSISRFLRHIPEVQNRYFDQKKEIPEEEKRRGYIVITADKGLAGAYNHNVIKMAHELFTQGENNKLFVVGELGRQYFAKEGLCGGCGVQVYRAEPVASPRACHCGSRHGSVRGK